MAQPPTIPEPPGDDSRRDLSMSSATGSPPAAPPDAGTPPVDEAPRLEHNGPSDVPDPKASSFAPHANKKAHPRSVPRVKTAPEGEAVENPSTWFEHVRQAISASISLIVHMLLVIIMGLWMLTTEEHRRPLLLSTSWSEDEGDTMAQLEEFATAISMEDSDALQSEIVEDNDPFDESEIPSPVPPEPLLGTIGFSGGGSPDDDLNQVLQGRAAGNREALVLSEGGNKFSEEAVALGLKWLARHQHPDGHWSLDEFHHVGNCNGQCKNSGGQSDTAATALALLPFLGAGQTQLSGDYTEVVGKALRWLVRAQESNGDLRGPGLGQMYAHGQAAMALCESYALTRDSFLREPAQLAINFIVKAQHSEGGWRYQPGQSGDTSVLGWQIMALRSAQMAYLDVPDETFKRATNYLEQAQTDDYGSRYSYVPGRPTATPSMTAEALLCRQYAGWHADEPGLSRGVDFLMREHPPDQGRADIYYWYYGTQVMHHIGGRPWALWNAAVRDMMIDSQHKQGHQAGSWDPVGRHTATGGRVYMTALSICILEVYYRHLPLYRQMAVER